MHAHDGDLADEAGPETPPAYSYWRRAGNAMPLLDLESGAHAWTATRWQRDRFPAEYRDDIRVLYDGVDARRFARREGAARIVAGRAIPADTRVVTFVARSLDRLRGFDRFIELANRLTRARPDVLVLTVGDAVVRQGLDVWFFNQDYRAHLLARTPLHDPERVWFLGTAAPAVVAEVLAATDLHVYPSRTYPVSRSLVEALAAGATVLAWDTEPVREFVEPGRTGLLVAPGDLDAAERLALAVLAAPAGHRPLGDAAAALVRERFAQDVTLPALAAWFGELAGLNSIRERA
jgi:glycosyltransferase involved in cell wall biosynthesis